MIVILTVLAVARVTRLITTDVLTRAPREWTLRALLVRKDGTAREDGFRAGLGYLIVCDWCVSVYVGAAAAGAYAAWGETMPFMGVTLALAASYATGFLATITDRGE